MKTFSEWRKEQKTKTYDVNKYRAASGGAQPSVKGPKINDAGGETDLKKLAEQRLAGIAPTSANKRIAEKVARVDALTLKDSAEKAAANLKAQENRLERFASAASAQETDVLEALKKYEATGADADLFKAASAYDNYLKKADAYNTYAVEAGKSAAEAENADLLARAAGKNWGAALIANAKSESDEPFALYELYKQKGETEKELEQVSSKTYSAPIKNIQTAEINNRLNRINIAIENEKNNDPLFSTYTQYQSTANGKTAQRNPLTNVYTETGYDDLKYEIINGNADAINIATASDVESGAAFAGVGEDYLKRLTNSEKQFFNYLYAMDEKAGDVNHSTAYAYIDDLKEDLIRRQREKTEDLYEEYAKESPVLASAFSALTVPLKSISAIGQAADFLDDGIIDENAGYNKFSHIPTAIRSTVSQTIENKWGPVGSAAYNIGMSIADSMIANGIGMVSGIGVAGIGGKAGKIAAKIAKSAGLAILGTSAMADTTLNAKARGLSDKQAFALGLIGGAAEYVTEKIGLEKLLDFSKLGSNAGRYILEAMGAEAAEEGISNVVNTLADVIVSHDKSEWSLLMDEYMAEGSSYNEAFLRALVDQAESLGLDMLAGAISGGFTSGITTAARAPITAAYRKDAETVGKYIKAQGDSTLDELVNAGLSAKQNGEAYRVAKEIEQKILKGKTVTDLEAGNLAMLTIPELMAEAQKANQAMLEESPAKLREEQQAAEQKETDAKAQAEEPKTATESVNAEIPATVAESATVPKSEGIMLPKAEAPTGVSNNTDQVQSVQESNPVTEIDPGMLPTAEQVERRATKSLEETAKLYNVETAKYERVKRISDVLGVHTEFYRSADANENGYYDRSNSTIYINANSRNEVAQIIGHELTHYIEGTDSYEALKGIAIARIRDTGGNIEQQLAKIRDKYSAAGHPLGDGGDYFELVAEYIEKNLLSNEQSIRELVRENRSLGQRILDWLDRILSKLGNSAAQERQFISRAREIYASALYETQAANQMAAESGDTYDKTMDMMQFSIGDIEGQKGSYGKGVLLDTNIFDGVRTRNWGKVLSKYVYKHLAGAELTMYDELGNAETVFLARENDRVKKEGAKNSHKVIEKLARYKGDNIRALTTVHIPEVLATSGNETYSDEHNHQWMDEKGWIFRTAYLQDRNGNIYEALLNIADGKDRRILYDITNIRKIDTKKEATDGDVSSTENGRDSHINSDSKNSITENGPLVKGQFGMNEDLLNAQPLIGESRSKSDIVKDLRSMLNSGASAIDLKRYVDTIGETNSSTGEYIGEDEASGADEILWAAHDRRMSVDEYLRENWELYEVDGKLNDDARRALDMERKRKRLQYSVGASSLTYEEEGAILQYKGSLSYKINEALRNNAFLTSEEQQFISIFDAALNKLPVYDGDVVYRNIVFDDNGGYEAFEAFMGAHKISKFITYRAYTSAGKFEDSYPVEGEYVVHLLIYNHSARDVEGYGNNFENEVIYKRDTIFKSINIEYNDIGEPIIYLEEDVSSYDGQFYPKTDYDSMRVLPTFSRSIGGEADLRSIPERDSNGNPEAATRSQRTLPRGQWDNVRRGQIDNYGYPIQKSISRDAIEHGVFDSFGESPQGNQENNKSQIINTKYSVSEPEPVSAEDFIDDVINEKPSAQKRTVKKKDFEEYAKTVQQYADVISAQTSEDKISTMSEAQSQTAGEKIKNGWSWIKRKMIDSGEAVAKIGKLIGDKHLYSYYNMARASSSAAVNMITEQRTDIYGRSTGKSLNDIMDPIRKKGEDYYRKFQLYMFHVHNIDRMSRFDQDKAWDAQKAIREYRETHPEILLYTDDQLRKMAANENAVLQLQASEYVALLDGLKKSLAGNKPVFGFDVKAEDSRDIAQRLLAENKSFEKEAQAVYDYIDNLMRYRVDSGLISEEDYKRLKEIYPHYVPTFRMWAGTKTDTRQKNAVRIGSTIKKAKGGSIKLIPLHQALAQQTMSVVREGSKNRFGMRFLDSEAQNAASDYVRNVEQAGGGFNENTFDLPEDDLVKRRNVFSVRKNGKQWDIVVSPALYEAVEALSPDSTETNAVVTLIRNGNNLFKALVTGYNPLFLVRNAVRDIQDSVIYSKSLRGFLAQYPQAIPEMINNGKYWQQYIALGGTQSSIFDYDTGDTKEESALKKKTIGRVEALNMAIEQAPRFAEFMATVKKAEADHGEATMDDLMEAMYNAAEITVNFGRSGTIGKKLNANFVPFLNPGIQGFSKMIRLVTETRGWENWLRLAAKAALFGVAPALINALIYHDDEEWEALKDRDKDLNYLFKIGDHIWFKLPKGRTLSVLGITADRAKDIIRGEDVDWKDYIEVVASQTAPANPLENNILQAWLDAKLFDENDPGETWYGTDIENQRLQKYAPSERYDAKTDKLSKWLGSTFNLSPAKINYLLDQYSGVVGDIILPFLTPTAERDMFTAGFTIDSNYSNKYSNEFYDLADRLEQRRNSAGGTDVDVVIDRWWNRQTSAVAEINAALRKIEADPALSNKDKKEFSSVQYSLRNALMKESLDIYEEYAAAAEKNYEAATNEDPEGRIDEAYLKTNREILGADYALKAYNKKIYNAAVQLRDQTGLDSEDFFDFYFAQRDAETTSEKRMLISDMDISDDQKEALYLRFVSKESADEIESFKKSGMDINDFISIQNTYAGIKNVSDKRTEFVRELNEIGLNEKQMDTALEALGYSTESESKYETFLSLGLDDDSAYELGKALGELKPEEGKKSVSYLQKYRTVLDAGLNESDQMAVLSKLMPESEYSKLQTGYEYGITPEIYVVFKELLPDYDADGNGTYKQEEVEDAIDSMGPSSIMLPSMGSATAGKVVLTNAEKAVLWQMANKSWKPNKNPYDTKIGEKIYNALNSGSDSKSSAGSQLPSAKNNSILPSQR